MPTQEWEPPPTWRGFTHHVMLKDSRVLDRPTCHWCLGHGVAWRVTGGVSCVMPHANKRVCMCACEAEVTHQTYGEFMICVWVDSKIIHLRESIKFYLILNKSMTAFTVKCLPCKREKLFYKYDQVGHHCPRLFAKS